MKFRNACMLPYLHILPEPLLVSASFQLNNIFSNVQIERSFMCNWVWSFYLGSEMLTLCHFWHESLLQGFERVACIVGKVTKGGSEQSQDNDQINASL